MLQWNWNHDTGQSQFWVQNQQNPIWSTAAHLNLKFITQRTKFTTRSVLACMVPPWRCGQLQPNPLFSFPPQSRYQAPPMLPSSDFPPPPPPSPCSDSWLDQYVSKPIVANQKQVPSKADWACLECRYTTLSIMRLPWADNSWVMDTFLLRHEPQRIWGRHDESRMWLTDSSCFAKNDRSPLFSSLTFAAPGSREKLFSKLQCTSAVWGMRTVLQEQGSTKIKIPAWP